MATNAAQDDASLIIPEVVESEAIELGATLKMILMPLASLKLTVALFAMAIFLVFAGTLAQVRMDIWEVIAAYFRTGIAWIDLQIFFPPAFFPPDPEPLVVPGRFPFPGGWLIGTLMAINLFAAHAVRFKVQASGNQLYAGLGVIAAGVLLTWLVIASGSNKEGVQELTLISWSHVWTLLKVGLGGLWLASVYALIKLDESQKTLRWIVIPVSLLLGGLFLWLVYMGDAARLGDPALRILWQLLKATLAALVLLAGCVMVFRKRAGIVLLHGGIALVMLNELLVGTLAVEAQMAIDQGQTLNFVKDIRTLELAVVDRSDPQQDWVVVVPEWVLRDNVGATELIQHEDLPFDIKVERFMKNSRVRQAKPGDDNPADRGVGLRVIAEEARPVAGTDTGGAMDNSVAYVKLLEKNSSNVLGTHLVGLFLSDFSPRGEIAETAKVEGKSYDVSLRFKRNYKPYAVTLLEVRKDDYPGTTTPMNYSSDIRLVDSTRDVDREIKIWMNNPLRFAGETFYQSGYHENPRTGVKTSTLAVVTNTGWMIPYVACMIVAAGLLAHFSIVLVRFLRRKDAEKSVLTTGYGAFARFFPLIIVLVMAAWVVSKAIPPRTPPEKANLYEFGKLPLVYQGRVKPFDTLARNSLRMISNKQACVDKSGETQPAIRWLLDVATGSKEAVEYEVFRIENLEVLDLLKLKRRKHLRYALSEFSERIDELEQQAKKARDADQETLSVYQRKILELDLRIRVYMKLLAAFRPPPLPPIPSREDFEEDRAAANQKLGVWMQELSTRTQELEQMQLPLAVPVKRGKKESVVASWESFSLAEMLDSGPARVMGIEPQPATVALSKIFAAHADGDAETFNKEVATYQARLAADRPQNLDTAKTSFEAFFNHVQPFYLAAAMYVFAFVLAALSWLGWSGPLNRAAFWLIVLTLALHTAALIARIYISGRPPVTNLYSSAVFIGWGCVALGLVFELMYRLGIGNVIAATAGFSTLLVAHFLSGDGDTFTVLQAVLDTQFWLATHVVCITLGYGTTFVAGFLGILYILRGVFTPSLSPQVGKDLARMIYGTLCFAIFFSFVGTVLGGLWADDSWGRFWGWDPKENGALIIVLWNVLVLHARFGGMVKDRGLAVLAVAGNIATSWSWFGVNELGVGLHSYGFTEGVLMTLLIFVVSQLAIIAIGSLPKDWWWSFRQ